jgi:hypothetical protein
MYEWQGHFGDAAHAAVAAFWLTDAKYNDNAVKAAYVVHVLGPGLPFLYSDHRYTGSLKGSSGSIYHTRGPPMA